ncbi:Sporulation domain-containing protein [Thermincola ferriacetica]|uniref:Sporulation domain-containing protein n=1 Tax=Thermincola ferriacetica TaxID=281456 RepID=A0A0L6W207_9FIRM|nr:SPOR domain-containing protein [Thermincola ferriacetica]KNZ69575.1 Sporulation domain-containing protein [Thermincola ferriacetica]
MRPNRKRLVAAMVIFFTVSALAIFFSAILGKAYLGILKSGGEKRTSQPPGAKAVVAEKQAGSVALTPVPVFYLQGGVYSDLESARQAAGDFLSLGLDPFITEKAPYRLYIGFFGTREEAYKFKDYLKEKEVGAFVQANMLNATELSFPEEKAELVYKWAPFLEKCSLFIKSLGNSCSFGSFERADRQAIERALVPIMGELDFLIAELDKKMPESGEFGVAVNGLADSARLLKADMVKLQSQWNQDNYNQVAKGLIQFVQAYINCWDQLAVPDTT